MPWTWNEKSHRYHDSATGRFLSKTEVLGYVQDSLDTARTAPATTLTGGINSAGTDLLSNLVSNGMMNPTDWHEMMREEIKREYIRQYMLGRGGRGSMASQDWGSIGGMLADQYRYLKDFAKLVQEGALSEGQIRARAAMYVNSAREGFERGQARNYGIPDGVLPAYPGDGQTQCLTNCACNWVFEEVYNEQGILLGWNCYWTLGIVKTEHCPDCLENTAKWNPLFITAGGEIVEGAPAPEVPPAPTPAETLPTEIPPRAEVPTFESVEEATEWAFENLVDVEPMFIGKVPHDVLVGMYVDYSGIPVDVANAFNREFYTMQTQYGLPKLTKIGEAIRSSSVAEFVLSEGHIPQLGISKDFIQELTQTGETLQGWITRVNADGFMSQRTVDDLAYHESLHYRHRLGLTADQRDLVHRAYKEATLTGAADRISIYANENEFEFLAEWGVAYRNGVTPEGIGRGRIDFELIDMLKQIDSEILQ